MSKTSQQHDNTRADEHIAKNVALVSRFYAPEVTADVIAEITAPDVVRDITPGFPAGAGGVYTGRDFGGALHPYISSLTPQVHHISGANDGRVYVSGHYAVTSQHGNEFTVRFVHEWTVQDGVMIKLVQTADSYIMHQAVTDRDQ